MSAPASPRESAARFLQEKLADGARPAVELERLAGEQGISSRTLRRARARLGVEAHRQAPGNPSSPWLWRLPAQAPDVDEPMPEGYEGNDVQGPARRAFIRLDAALERLCSELEDLTGESRAFALDMCCESGGAPPLDFEVRLGTARHWPPDEAPRTDDGAR